MESNNLEAELFVECGENRMVFKVVLTEEATEKLDISLSKITKEENKLILAQIAGSSGITGLRAAGVMVEKIRHETNCYGGYVGPLKTPYKK